MSRFKRKIILQQKFTYKYNLYNLLTEWPMNFHSGGDLVLGQARAEFNYCLLSGRRFSLEKEIKEREEES